MDVPKRNPRVLVGCTGSVATIKLKDIVETLLVQSVDVRVVATDHSTHFFDLAEIPNGVEVYRDSDEWTMWNQRGDPVLHIELGKWADILVLAPLDANTLAKVSQGLCDNLLTCVVRAWDLKKPLLFCPAMNTRMWEHPVTATQIAALKSWGYYEVPCIAKTLICGDTGLGAMAEVSTIVNHVMNALGNILIVT